MTGRAVAVCCTDNTGIVAADLSVFAVLVGGAAAQTTNPGVAALAGTAVGVGCAGLAGSTLASLAIGAVSVGRTTCGAGALPCGLVTGFSGRTVAVRGTADAGLVVAEQQAFGFAVLVCCAFGFDACSTFALGAVGAVGVLGANGALALLADLSVGAVGSLGAGCDGFAFALVTACLVPTVFVVLAGGTLLLETDFPVATIRVGGTTVVAGALAFLAWLPGVAVGVVYTRGAPLLFAYLTHGTVGVLGASDASALLAGPPIETGAVGIARNARLLGADFPVPTVLRCEAIDAVLLFGVTSLAARAVVVLAATLNTAVV